MRLPLKMRRIGRVYSAIVEDETDQMACDAVHMFVQKSGVNLSNIDVIGYHGQTVLHRPEKAVDRAIGDSAKNWPIGSRVPVVYDMRANDMMQAGRVHPWCRLITVLWRKSCARVRCAS